MALEHSDEPRATEVALADGPDIGLNRVCWRRLRVPGFRPLVRSVVAKTNALCAWVVTLMCQIAADEGVIS